MWQRQYSFAALTENTACKRPAFLFLLFCSDFYTLPYYAVRSGKPALLFFQPFASITRTFNLSQSNTKKDAVAHSGQMIPCKRKASLFLYGYKRDKSHHWIAKDCLLIAVCTD